MQARATLRLGRFVINTTFRNASKVPPKTPSTLISANSIAIGSGGKASAKKPETCTSLGGTTVIKKTRPNICCGEYLNVKKPETSTDCCRISSVKKPETRSVCGAKNPETNSGRGTKKPEISCGFDSNKPVASSGSSGVTRLGTNPLPEYCVVTKKGASKSKSLPCDGGNKEKKK